MQLAEPWIDPINCEMEDILDERAFHLVFLMNSSTDKFDLVSADELVKAHSRDTTNHTTNMLAISIEKSDVEGISADGKVQTQAIPRTQIRVDTIFVDMDDMTAKQKEAFATYFEFV